MGGKTAVLRGGRDSDCSLTHRTDTCPDAKGERVILRKHNGQKGKQGTHIQKNHSAQCKIPDWPQHPHLPANIFHIYTNITKIVPDTEESSNQDKI